MTAAARWSTPTPWCRRCGSTASAAPDSTSPILNPSRRVIPCGPCPTRSSRRTTPIRHRCGPSRSPIMSRRTCCVLRPARTWRRGSTRSPVTDLRVPTSRPVRIRAGDDLLPGTVRDLGLLDKDPVDLTATANCQIIGECRGQINSCSVVPRFRRPEHVIDVIIFEWADVLPLSISDFLPVPDFDPAILDHRSTRLNRTGVPGNDPQFGVRLEAEIVVVAVGQGEIERIFSGCEFARVRTAALLGIVDATVAADPVPHPGRRASVDEIIGLVRTLARPENRRGNTPVRKPGTLAGRDTVVITAVHRRHNQNPGTNEPENYSNSSFRFCRRSEERRVGKECRSRWSPY